MRPLTLAHITFLLALTATSAADVRAQDPPGTFGVGFAVSRPSGLTLKHYRQRDLSLDFLLAWNLHDFYFTSLHVQYEHPLPAAPLHYFAGPGIYLAVGEASAGHDANMGVSSNLGLNFFTEAFEVFIQATPRLRLTPSLHPHLDGGVGLRYYFRSR